MKRTLYSKFIMAYILLGVLGTVLIATLGSSLIQNHILEDTGAACIKKRSLSPPIRQIPIIPTVKMWKLPIIS